MAYNSTNTGAEIQTKLDSITPVTTTADGLMSSTDKSKLDGITESADAVSVTQSLTSGTEVGSITVNGTATKLYAPTATTEVFWATYGTTTSAELEAAYQAGKLIACGYGSFVYIMQYRTSSTSHKLIYWDVTVNNAYGVTEINPTIYYLNCISDTWTNGNSTINDATSFDSTTAIHGLLSAYDKIILDRLSYYLGRDISRNAKYSSVTTLASIPINGRLVLASLSAATTLSLASNLQAGQELHIICTPTASFTQPIPNSGSWISMDGSSLTVTSGVPFEINILYDGTYYRVKVLTKS